MSITTKFIIRNGFVADDGTCNIKLRVTIDRKVKYFKTPYHTKPVWWNAAKETVSSRHVDSKKINMYITRQKSLIGEIIFNYEVYDSIPSFDDFIRKLKPTFNRNCFYSFCDMLDQDTVRFSKSAILSNRACIHKLQEFRKELSIQEINYDFINDFRTWLLFVKKNKLSTVDKNLKYIKARLNDAIKAGLIRENCLNSFKLKSYEGDKPHLTLAQVQKLTTLLNTPGALHETHIAPVRSFLFACYTGLRYLDVKNLRMSNISYEIIGGVGISIIRLRQHKGDKPNAIPLCNEAMQLIHDSPHPLGMALRVYQNQPTNRSIKAALKQAGIPNAEKFSFHCGRHTFATIANTIGIPLDVIATLLAHSSTRTTKIYAKFTETLKAAEIQKFNTATG